MFQPRRVGPNSLRLWVRFPPFPLRQFPRATFAPLQGGAWQQGSGQGGWRRISLEREQCHVSDNADSSPIRCRWPGTTPWPDHTAQELAHNMFGFPAGPRHKHTSAPGDTSRSVLPGRRRQGGGEHFASWRSSIAFDFLFFSASGHVLFSAYFVGYLRRCIFSQCINTSTAQSTWIMLVLLSRCLECFFLPSFSSFYFYLILTERRG
jgi:hypothetical protein